jgi:small subunit ribosomal protein S7
MSRRHRAERREINPDAKFGDLVLAKFMNSLMYDGKKSAAEGIIYGAFDTLAAKTKQDPLQVFHDALKNVSPALEVRSRRVGGATYQVPVEVRPRRATTLAIRWIVENARDRREKTMAECLANEILDASNGLGASMKKRDDMQKMAESNKAFAHYRW